MAQPSKTSSELVKPSASVSLVPRFFTNTVETFNVLSDASLRGAKAIDRLVMNIDHVTSIALEQQKCKLLAELEKSGGTIKLD